MRRVMHSAVLPILGGTIIAGLTALLFWLVERYML